ncbi:MAG: hypothetical protein DRZ76_03920 [Candidatus Nealsonbacteria bacterium]|nr:MAG: hypothetical protein DRZ76_03920 [Candidatus Nealsonbacteria bacterium]
MAIGDMFADIQSVASNDYLDIRPAAGNEAVIHNIYHEASIEIYRYDGSNSLLCASASGSGVFAYYAFHVGNTDRIRVKNTESSAKLIGYDGIYTKVT